MSAASTEAFFSSHFHEGVERKNGPVCKIEMTEPEAVSIYESRSPEPGTDDSCRERIRESSPCASVSGPCRCARVLAFMRSRVVSRESSKDELPLILHDRPMSQIFFRVYERERERRHVVAERPRMGIVGFSAFCFNPDKQKLLSCC